jgi:glycosyltransferase involved in cell wall biosynthesis/SAM-dependent methyltransferase
MNLESMSRLRILLLGPDCDPERVSIRFVTYSHAAALARLHDVTLVARSPVEDSLRRAKAPLRAIEVVRLPWLERIYAWSLRCLFRYNNASQALTAFGYPFYVAFEWRAWRQLRRRIFVGEFDVVLRLVPMTPVLPSPFAFFLRKGPIPFVIGPINGGLPFVQGFSQASRQKEWISGLRSLYRFLPFARSTYRNATAIIAASSQTYAEFAAYPDKLFFVPEPGIDRSLCFHVPRSLGPGAMLQLIFVGGLIPCKACDLALRAAAPLLRNDLARFTVVGDGPERNRLERLTRSLGIEKAVSFCGWVSHAEVLSRLRSSDVMVFPSVRDFGAGVVFEALATGAVPVVADFGGPGDIVHPEVGFKVPLTNESEFVAQMEKVLTELEANRDLLNRLRQQGMSYARERLTWDAKAHATTRVLNWAAGRGPKPNLPPPKLPHLQRNDLISRRAAEHYGAKVAQRITERPTTVTEPFGDEITAFEECPAPMEDKKAVQLKQYTMKRIKRVLRPFIRRTLSPTTVQVLRFRCWCLSSYLPRLLSSRLIRRTPQVRGFGSALVPSNLAEQLQSVNLLAPTKVCRIMTKYGSDKGRSNNYTPLYSALFKERYDQPLRIFELGLGSNDPDVPSNMGVFGAPGASLRGWRQLFTRALVYGADIDRKILFEENRIKTFYCDQLDRSSIRELWSHEDLRGGMDIIIEDGLHTFEANVAFLEACLDHLRPGGIYITEDIGWDCLDEWYHRLETIYSKKYPTYDFAFVVLANRGYNNLLVVRRTPDEIRDGHVIIAGSARGKNDPV